MRSKVLAGAALLVTAAGCATVPPAGPSGLSSLRPVAEVDERFQSYNVEMVEVTGGRFWAPYGGPPGEVYRQRPPEDLADRKLRALARHLGPAYMRVSGTWANSTYLEAEGEHLAAPPAGFRQVLTRAQWRGVIDFAAAVNAKIGLSWAVSDGVRGPDGHWKSEQAQRLVDLTRQAGGEIAWSEFINEPNAASQGHLPVNYAVPDYTRDFRTFREWAARAAPRMKIVGPGGVGEGAGVGNIPVADRSRYLLTEELMQASPGTVDVMSYHFYGIVSQRCAARRPTYARKDEALDPAWLDLTLRDLGYYSALRDRFEPGDPIWITETAQAACGGSPWASTFLDTFRYVNQLGLLAQRGVKVVFHNTLAASDYALIDQETRTPRPNYWAAVLWRRTMGTTVLASPSSPSPDLRLYAHCLPGRRGGVGLAAINLGDSAREVTLGARGRGWVLQGAATDSPTITVSGRIPTLAPSGHLEGLEGEALDGVLAVPAKSIAFAAVPAADNPACR